MQHPVEEKQKILPHWQTSRHSVCAVHILRLEPWNHENIYDHQRQSMHNETPTQKKKKKISKRMKNLKLTQYSATGDKLSEKIYQS